VIFKQYSIVSSIIQLTSKISKHSQ